MPIESNQWLQVPGALLLLVAFALLVMNRVPAQSPIYTGLNCIGGSLLGYEAWRTEQFGFLLLEGTWALIALFGLSRWVFSIVASTPSENHSSQNPQ